MLLLLLGVLVIGGIANALMNPSSSAPKALSAEQLAAVDQVHAQHAWIRPKSVEVNSSGIVVVDYELAEGTLIPPRTIGQQRLLAIREALLPFGYNSYRVNVNGPPPGTGLVHRYGSARFLNGGSLEWITP